MTFFLEIALQMKFCFYRPADMTMNASARLLGRSIALQPVQQQPSYAIKGGEFGSEIWTSNVFVEFFVGVQTEVTLPLACLTPEAAPPTP